MRKPSIDNFASHTYEIMNPSYSCPDAAYEEAWRPLVSTIGGRQPMGHRAIAASGRPAFSVGGRRSPQSRMGSRPRKTIRASGHDRASRPNTRLHPTSTPNLTDRLQCGSHPHRRLFFSVPPRGPPCAWIFLAAKLHAGPRAERRCTLSVLLHNLSIGVELNADPRATLTGHLSPVRAPRPSCS